jgi:hypothetical protein
MILTGYSFANNRYPHASTAGATIEDPEAIIVSGTTSQQRDAVLANFAKYGNRIGESTTWDAKTRTRPNINIVRPRHPAPEQHGSNAGRFQRLRPIQASLAPRSAQSELVSFHPGR